MVVKTDLVMPNITDRLRRAPSIIMKESKSLTKRSSLLK